MPGDPFSAAPDGSQQRLLDTVASIYLRSGKWPRWPWVEETLEREGINARAVIASMPGSDSDIYGFLGRLGVGRPDPQQEIRLRIVGLRHVEAANALVSYFVRVVKALGDLRTVIELDPFDNVLPTVSKTEVARAMHPSSPPDMTVLALLGGEPATWNCQVGGDTDGEWTISLTPGIRRFAGVRDVGDYLARLQAFVVSSPAGPQRSFPVSPFTLPAALDFLDVIWQKRFGEPLLGRPGLERSSRLAWSVTTGEEADSALSALAEVIKTFEVPSIEGVGGGPLERLGPFLVANLPESATERVHEAVEVFRAAQSIRHGQQHSGTEVAKLGAYVTLGLTYPVPDWAAAWEQIQIAVSSAADALREEIQASG